MNFLLYYLLFCCMTFLLFCHVIRKDEGEVFGDDVGSFIWAILITFLPPFNIGIFGVSIFQVIIEPLFKGIFISLIKER